MDDKTKRGPPDINKISLTEDYEVSRWCKHFHCTRGELVAAVHGANSHMKDAVEAYFKKHPPKGPPPV